MKIILIIMGLSLGIAHCWTVDRFNIISVGKVKLVIDIYVIIDMVVDVDRFGIWF